MRPLTLEEMVIAVEGRVYGSIGVPSVTSVSTDSRTTKPGALFIAIKGENHDGHAYVGDVLDRGAVAAVVSDLSGVPKNYQTGGRIIQVPDTIAALARLATWYRKQFAAQVIGVVGSNGKTTTKDMIAAVLGHRRKGRAAKASFNNHIGVPLTLLDVEPADEFVVVEIGTNHPGEITALGRIAKPDIAVLTSIGEEHLEFFHDLEGVAAEEFSILSTVRGRGLLIMSEQAAQFATPARRNGMASLVYGLDEKADLRATDITAAVDGQSFKVNGRFECRIPVLGRHNVVNTLAAVAIAMRFRMADEDISAALAGIRLPSMRMELRRIGDMTLINDAYNANPSSMRTAFEVMDGLPATDGRKVLILGDMRELGDESQRCHQMVGRDAGRSSARVIITVGSMSRVMADGATGSAGTTKRIYAFPSVEALSEKIGELLQDGDVVLLKASRGMRLERLIDSIAAPAVSVRS